MRIETKLIYAGVDTTSHTKIICASLFRMKRSYRGFQKYLDFCIQFVHQVKRILPTWTLRIYVDDSVKHSELDKLVADHVEIVHYKCDAFWDAESGTHEGVFGTFMRFLPMFSAQKYDVMASSDIDIGDFILEYFVSLSQSQAEIGLVNQLCYNDWVPADTKYNILAGGIVSKVVFPRYILTRFLEEMKEGKRMLKIIKQTDADTYMPYGTDEYFLNTKVYSYIEKHNLRVLAYTISSVVGAIRKIIKPLKDDKERMDAIERSMKKLTYLDMDFWRDPRSLRPDAFVKYVSQIIAIAQPELDESRHKQCVMTYINEPRMVRKYKYNY